MINFNWDITKLIQWFLPSFLRNDMMVAWLRALLKPVDEKHDEFVQFVSDKRYELDFTGQVISLERLLNDQFDSTLRRIFINNVTVDENFIFSDGDVNLPSEDLFIFSDGDANLPSESNFFFFNDTDEAISDFIVNVPDTIVFDESELKAFVNKYKLAGKNYVVKLFTP